jgi:hypothetical protein
MDKLEKMLADLNYIDTLIEIDCQFASPYVFSNILILVSSSQSLAVSCFYHQITTF